MASQSRLDFTVLGDLRDMHPRSANVQSGFLQYQLPVHYLPSLHPSEGGPGDMSGMDVFVCAVRHLYAHHPLKWRDGADIRQEELKNPVLRFAWSDLGRREDCVQAQNSLREGIADYLLGGHFGVANLSFLGLAESRLMHQTLFAREPFQLYHPNPMSQRIAAQEPGEEDEPENENWDLENGRSDPAEMAKRSLITWNGLGDLGDLVSSKFGIFENPSTNMRYYFSSGTPAFIRVHYYAPATDAPEFNDLKEIIVDGKEVYLRPGTEICDIPPKEQRARRYVLIMTVRLGEAGAGGDCDLIRRYSLDGKEVVAPRGFHYANETWRLGESGRQYMLFYCMAQEDSTSSSTRLPEVQKMPKGFIQNVRNIASSTKAARESRHDTGL
ncbi:hypothetical protein F5Y05DRAFT_421877 [Hypoxylon sp. FL0543]|nr:hypothetical protein F5Y05DRAFT_421877 [Hypoxylon sp. FL0543]